MCRSPFWFSQNRSTVYLFHLHSLVVVFRHRPQDLPVSILGAKICLFSSWLTQTRLDQGCIWSTWGPLILKRSFPSYGHPSVTRSVSSTPVQTIIRGLKWCTNEFDELISYMHLGIKTIDPCFLFLQAGSHSPTHHNYITFALIAKLIILTFLYSKWFKSKLLLHSFLLLLPSLPLSLYPLVLIMSQFLYGMIDWFSLIV